MTQRLSLLPLGCDGRGAMSDFADNVNVTTHECAICEACREPIHSDAKLCKHCGTHRGWRKHLALSSTVLALLVALISVITAALPVFIKAFRPARSQVELKISRVSFDTLFVIASNYGDRPGSVAGGAILSVGNLQLGRPVILLNAQSERFIPPGISRELGFRIPEADQAYLASAVIKVQGSDKAVPHGSIVTRLPPGVAVAGVLLRASQFGAKETKILTGIPLKCAVTCNWGA